MYTVVAENVEFMRGEKNFIQLKTIDDVQDFIKAVRGNLSTIDKLAGARLKIFYKGFYRQTIDFRKDIPDWKLKKYCITLN